MEPTSESPETGLPLLLEISVRRLEYQDRVFDSLTARAALIFGFTTSALPASVWVLHRLQPVLWLQCLEAVVLLALYAVMAVFCWKAYAIKPLSTWPKVQAMYGEGYHRKPLAATQDMALQQIASAYVENEPVVAQKAKDVRRAIFFLAAELAAIIIGALLPKCVELLPRLCCAHA